MSVSGAFPLRSFPPDATAQALDWLAPKQKSHFTEAFLSDQPSPFSNHAQLGAALSFPQSVQQSHATHPFAQQQQQSSLMTLLQQMQHPQQHPLFQQQSPQQSQQQQQYISPQQQWQQLQQSQPQGRPLDRPVSPASLTSDSSPPRSGERDHQSVSPFSANTISSSEGGSVSPGPILPQKAKPSKKSKQQTSPTTDPQEQIRSRKKDQSKRGLTKCACVPCRKIKAACESTRPCARCVRVGKSELCIDHVPLPRGGYRVPKAKRLAEQNAAQQEAPPPAHTLSHPTTSQPLFEASGLLLDLVPQQYSQQYSEAVASAPNPEESADWSACLPPPSFTPVSELMWLEDEALFSLLDQFDKEAQNPSRKNQQLLVSMAWVLCDVICFSGCFRAPASKDSGSDGGSAVHPISQRRSSASSTDSGSSSLVPSSPKKSLFSASSVGLDSSHPFFPLFRSLASPDNVKRERLWSLLNTWKHASEIQQTLQLMARAAPDDTVRDLYEAELVKSAFLPFGVVVCPLNHYLAPGLPPVTNHKLNAMLGYSKEDAEVVCSSCPFYRMSERHSLSNIKRLAYQAIRHGRTSFTLPMTFIHKNNQSLRVVVSLKLKYHNYLPMLCVCYVQLADASSTGQVVELQGPSL